VIDFHVHMGNLYRESYPHKPSLSAHQLVDRMNREGIEIGVILPLESPEGGWGYLLTEDAVAARDLYPERLIAFACVDPRYPKAAELTEIFVKRYGCRGFGEHVNDLPFDHPLNKAIYAKCDELGLPLVFEISRNYCSDDYGLPRLESCLKEFPNVAFVGHGPGFWSAISGNDDRQGGYPTGPIAPGGAVDRLLAQYANLYADLSAYSGYNAMTRDPEFTAGFVLRNSPKLLWGTDYMGAGQELPHVAWMKTLEAPEPIRAAIASGNARRLLKLDK